MRRTGPNGHDFRIGLIKFFLTMTCSSFTGFRIQQHIEMRLSHLRNIAGCGAHGRGDIHLNAELKQKICDLSHIVPMPKT